SAAGRSRRAGGRARGVSEAGALRAGGPRARGDGPVRVSRRVPRPLLREAALQVRPARARRALHLPRARARRRRARPCPEPEVRVRRGGAGVIRLVMGARLLLRAVACGGTEKTRCSYEKTVACFRG